MRDPPSFAILIDLLKIKVQELGTSIDAIVGLDSRGFIFGSVLAYDLQKPFVPIRKKGKLPGEIEKVNFKLEYGEVMYIALSFILIGPYLYYFFVFCLY